MYVKPFSCFPSLCRLQNPIRIFSIFPPGLWDFPALNTYVLPTINSVTSFSNSITATGSVVAFAVTSCSPRCVVAVIRYPEFHDIRTDFSKYMFNFTPSASSKESFPSKSQSYLIISPSDPNFPKRRTVRTAVFPRLRCALKPALTFR